MDLSAPHGEGVAAVVDNKLYMVGGRVRATPQASHFLEHVDTRLNEAFDPETGRWEQWVPEHKVFGKIWVYDPKTDRWEALPPLPTPRHGLGASALGNRIHVFGGATKTGGNTATAVHEVLNLP